jgi:hypothetical protein
MSTPALQRPATISIKNLSSAVQAAVKAVGDRQKIEIDHKLHVSPIIMGIILRPEQLLNSETVAAAITTQMGDSHGAGRLEPAVLIKGGVITCGFIAPEVILSE